jgi:hypothetical protein
MSDRHHEIELPTSPEEARASVLRAGEELGWQVSEEDDCLIVRERPRVLSGHWPVGIRVSVESAAAPGRSLLRLWGRMGGFGPFIAERLKEQMEDFESRLPRGGQEPG